MSKKIDSVLKEALKEIKPTEEELGSFNEEIDRFLVNLKEKINKLGVYAEVFVGGSFAKKTVTKKDQYDADIFLRFGGKHEIPNISQITEKLLKDFKDVQIIHGSRDYFKIKIRENFFLEIIPVKKINKQKDAENITDLSYSHVNYINKKIKDKKILDEILLAKAFCHAKNSYGAESYIKGFSGYSLELLIYHYKSFIKFIREMIKVKLGEKLVLDIEKQFKNRKSILMDINSSKLQSPVILIDPTYKHRNVLAALSEKTFSKFQKECEKFLKYPEKEEFKIKKTDLKKIKEISEKKKLEFILLEAKTGKQSGDVAGSKLLKFYNHLGEEIKKYFIVKEKGFNYNHNQSARYYFVVKNKGEILIHGPGIKDKKNVKSFERKHRDYFTRKGKIYSKQKIDFTLKEFVKTWKIKNKGRLKEMYIEKLDFLKNTG